MRRLVATPVLVAVLGCSGALRQGSADSISQMTVKIERDVPTASAERSEALDRVDRMWIATWEGEVGFWTLARFGAAVDDAVRDGAIDPDDVANLDAVAEPYADLGLDAEHVSDLLAVKATFDDRARRDLGLAGPGDPDLGPLPTDPGAALTAVGWIVDRCTPMGSGQSCQAHDHGRSATVVLAPDAGVGPIPDGAHREVDPSGALTVQVVDGDASAEVADGLAEVGTIDQLQQALADLGWAEVRCPTTDPGAPRGTCTGRRGEAWVLVRFPLPFTRPGPSRSRSADGAAVGALTVRVVSGDASAALAADLRGSAARGR